MEDFVQRERWRSPEAAPQPVQAVMPEDAPLGHLAATLNATPRVQATAQLAQSLNQRPSVVAQAQLADRLNAGSPDGHRSLQRVAAPISAPLQRRPAAKANKAKFNMQQAADLPAKDALVTSIDDNIGTMARGQNLDAVWQTREWLDLLVSTYTDGLIGFEPDGGGAAEKAAAWALQPKILLVRQAAELGYQMLVGSSDDVASGPFEATQSARIAALWAPIATNAALVTAVIQNTGKTGARETRSWGVEGDVLNPLETDNSIDIRAAKLVETVKADGFVPDIVVGLPTAGAHLASRVAGILDAKSGQLASMTKTIAMRPRYVKDEGKPATPQAEIDALNKTQLETELAAQFGVLKQSWSYYILGHTVRVLVVDDFSLSGGSLSHAATLVTAALTATGLTPDVRTAVSRYNSPQMRSKITVAGAQVDNPIDYLVGQELSGRRAAVGEHFLDPDGGFREAHSHVIGDLERGWTEPGKDGLAVAGL